uniref:Uncharacterized protein n=1 Tax=Rhizophora mucronata TaxID=61149 RepID=A0A2P2PY30_RHIMU
MENLYMSRLMHSVTKTDILINLGNSNEVVSLSSQSFYLLALALLCLIEDFGVWNLSF